MHRAARILGRPASPARGIPLKVNRPVLKPYELNPNDFSVEFTNCELRGQ